MQLLDSWMCIWETTKRIQRKARGAAVIYLWISSTTSKRGLTVRALAVDVAQGGERGVPISAAGPTSTRRSSHQTAFEQTAFGVTVDSLYTPAVSILKSSPFSRFTPWAAAAIDRLHSTTQQNSSGHESVCCTVNYQYFFFTNSCSWKANWEHAQNLFNNLENKLLCVTTGKIVGEITSGWLFPHRQGASAGDLN